MLRRSLTLISVAMLFLPTPLFAWGERAHDVIARVAVRLLAAKFPKDENFTTPFLRKEQMLGHLANVPDIVWRSRNDLPENPPTHQVDLELLGDTSNVVKLLEQETSLKKAREAGSLPWRIRQLERMLVTNVEAVQMKVSKRNKSHLDS